MVIRNSQQLIHSGIDTAIESTRQLFQTKPDYFLTEEDLRSHLFLKLQEQNCLKQESPTRNGTVSIPIHSEVRWYGNGRLKCRSDIVVLKVESLRTSGEVFQLPTKGFGFNNFYAVIELKLRRKRGESDKVFIKNIRKDVDKLLKIKTQTQDENFGAKFYVVVFDRKNNIQELKRKVKHPFPDDAPMVFCYAAIP